MRPALLTLCLLLTAAFSLTTRLEPWFQSWAGNRAKSANLLTVTLGDSRRLFAKHFYVKADAYFHSGYYPTIYDNHPASNHKHMAAASHELVGQASRQPAEEPEEEGADFLGKPKDWIDAFSRHFYPSTHRHLGEAVGSGHHEKPSGREERELLPWLRLSASLDPERPETYTVASFWLRSHLKKVDEAEQFLREGLQANPGNYEILLELGRIYKENRNDPIRARNVWELGVRNWRETESAKADPNIFPYAQLLGNLAKLEEEQQNYSKAIEHLTPLKQISPNRDSIQKWIDDLKAKQAPGPLAPPP
jgi:tetratricopeptide (TPR) repeat protein